MRFWNPVVLVVASVVLGASAAAAADTPPAPGAAEEAGTMRGKVVLKANGAPLHKATVLISKLGRTTETSEDGEFEFKNVPAGSYGVTAHLHALSDVRRTVEVKAGAVATVDFELEVATVREQITVTASGEAQSTFEALLSTTTLEPVDLVQKNSTSIGDVLDGLAGVAKRSFGAGNSRPVLRGFDGDRVLVMLDGLGTGSLSSQSADHGENLNALSLDSVEVVRGSATLLYGSNAIGGVVNATSGHHVMREHPHEGLSGYLSGSAGTTNNLFGGGVGLEYGWKKWTFRTGGGAQRTGDYGSPLGAIANSRSRNGDVRFGFSRYGGTSFVTFTYDYDNRRYGIPFAVFLESGGADGGFIAPGHEVINLRPRRHDLKLSTGARNLKSFVSDFNASVGYVHYRHGEFDDDILGTDFTNKAFNYRITFDQRRVGKLGGSFGLSGQYRDYNTVGPEAVAPPVIQNNFAVFAVETLNLPRASIQFGGRFEHAGYGPGLHSVLGAQPDRSFNGFSGAAGLRVPLWPGGAVVMNYTHSYRSPALEELYNFGDHPGNVAFEIGNPGLRREAGNGVDLSLRHSTERARFEANYFFYALQNYVFLSPTGNLAPSGFIEAEYLQSDTRYSGVELTADMHLYRGWWVFGGLDFVSAKLTQTITSPTTSLLTPEGTPLPRIPPLRGRLGVDFRWKGLSVRPEGAFTRDQGDLFPTETRTPGYALFNVNATYTIASQHRVQIFSVSAFNLNNRLYRNHLSFIKDLAAEIGRGVRFGYTVRFF
jgi:iron complex outermembrane receptor protein